MPLGASEPNPMSEPSPNRPLRVRAAIGLSVLVVLVASALSLHTTLDAAPSAAAAPATAPPPRPAARLQVPLRDTVLPEEIATALRRAGLPTSAVSFFVEPIDAYAPRPGTVGSPSAIGGRFRVADPGTATMTTPQTDTLPPAAPVLSWQAETPRNPASVMKLVTSLVALDELGPTYTWTTDLLATGTVTDGVLNGDLVLRGHGDPYLMAPDVWSMVRALRKTGLRRITGGLIVDDSWFQLPPEDPAAFDGAPNKPYNALPSAVLLNLKLVEVTLRPENNVARFETDPALPSLEILNDVRLTNEPCTSARRNGVALQVLDTRTANAIRVTGRYPWRCGPIRWPRTLMTHDRYALGMFTALWREQGGDFGGQLATGPAPTNARLLLSWRGRTLAEAIRPMNKTSNNVMARQMLLTLGAERLGAPGTPQKGAQAVADYVTRLGLDPISIRVTNGSGLSRHERVTARLLGGLLVRGARMPFASEFISSMSVAGYDGTTRRRFSGRAEAGEMHLKSGRLNDVAALAGYVRSRSGRMYVVVGFINHPRVAYAVGEPVLNSLVQWVYRQ